MRRKSCLDEIELLIVNEVERYSFQNTSAQLYYYILETLNLHRFKKVVAKSLNRLIKEGIVVIAEDTNRYGMPLVFSGYLEYS